jgi:hypothetical protein
MCQEAVDSFVWMAIIAGFMYYHFIAAWLSHFD